MAVWTRLLGPFQRHFRRQRANTILARFPDINQAVVIDIGGSLTFWRAVSDIIQPRKIIIYNIDDGRMKMGVQQRDDRIELHLYDGDTVPQPDHAADIVICNSVIEHVPLDQRSRLAGEVMRVGKRFVVQTPAREFPIELHFLLPFVHWLPRSLGRVAIRISPFALLSGANAVQYFDQTQLLSREEFSGYFPSANLEVERVLGIPKSMLAFGYGAAG